MRNEDWDTALAITARFQRLGEHAEAIRRAANGLNNKQFYEQLGYDLDEIKAAGIAALKERFSSSWKEAEDSRPEREA
jgi:hypothetical protein